MLYSVRPHRQQPNRLPHPRDSPGKNTGVGYHFLLQCTKVKSESEVAQSYLTLSDPMDCSLPGSSIHGIFHARVLEWGAIAFSNNYYPNNTAFPNSSIDKESPCNAGGSGSIPGSGRSAGEGDGASLQYSCLENPMDGGAWCAAVHGVAESWTRLSDFPFIFHFHALEKEMATHSSVLAWRIPGIEEPGGLPSMGLHRVGHN